MLQKFILVPMLAVLLYIPAAGADVPGVKADEVLRHATDIGSWLSAQEQKEATGASWPDNALARGNNSVNLSSGIPGTVLFLLGLHNATGNMAYLESAQRGADFLVTLVEDPSVFEGNQRRASLYAGIGGIGVALVNMQAVAPQPGYERAISRIVDILDDWHLEDDAGAYWSDEYNDLLFGNAGTVLFLAFAAEQTGNEKALHLAVAGAESLLRQAQAGEHGLYWKFRRSRDFNLPNFSHGAAGIGYALSSVAMVSGEEQFADAARDAFRYLQSIQVTHDQLVAMPYGWGVDSWDGLYEFGWAHGVAGSALFLQRLQQAGDDTGQVAAMSAAFRDTLIGIGLPANLAPPFSEPSTPLDQRFGRAGVLGVLSEWSRQDESVIAARDDIFTHIRDAATRDNGAYWMVAVPAFMGGGTAAYTGYFHGASGIGLAMLKMHAAMTGKDPYVVLPDDPFAWQPR